MRTGRTALDPRKTFDLRRTFDIHRTINIRRTLSLRKTPNIRKILLPLDGRNGTYGVSETREDKAGGPVLDAEEVIVLLSTNVKA
jgi:hypothetical protein